MKTVSIAGLQPGESALPLIKHAHNSATESENKIHDDAEARRLGLKGGLVPGVTLYAYLTELVLSLLGPAWLKRGTCTVRFVRPVYEGEEISCTATLAYRTGDDSAGDASLDLAVLGPGGDVCVTGSAGVRRGSELEREAWEPPQQTLDVARGREPLTRESAPLSVQLAPRFVTVTAEAVEAYADEVGDPNPFYRGGSPYGLPLVPPGLLAGQPARLLRQNFEFGPSVHAGSEIQHTGLALAGGDYRVDAAIIETFEKRNNDYLVADVHITDHTGALVMRIRHTSIFRFAARA